MIEKKQLRAELKRRRAEHVAAIPEFQRSLLFRRPPEPVMAMVPEGAVVSVFHEMAGEVPASNYGRWFYERGHRIALPWLEARGAPMRFREWTNPFLDDLLVPDPYGAMQPSADAELLVPEVMFCPLLGFTSSGGRIGYGAGFYDRWLAENPPRLAIGLAWDCQLEEDLPIEPHDVPLHAVITPTRLYGPF
ncbi:MAG: 5-formyltetrahydrofolate cyclo-ligase [Novosphingobium sp.]